MGAEWRQRLSRAERIDHAHAQQEHAGRGDEGDDVAVEVGGREHRDAADERDQQSIANGPIQPEAGARRAASMPEPNTTSTVPAKNSPSAIGVKP